MKTVSAFCLALLLAACAGAPEVRFHSLLPSELSTSVGPGSSPGMRLRLGISAVKVPAAVDQPQWLVRRPDDTLQALEQDRWASPLGDEFRAALREGLAQRWGVLDGATPGASPPSWRLVMEVLRLEARPGRDTLLEARWTLVSPQAGATCVSTLRETVSADGAVALAEAHRRAVFRLTDAIGGQLLALASGGATSCRPPA